MVEISYIQRRLQEGVRI